MATENRRVNRTQGGKESARPNEGCPDAHMTNADVSKETGTGQGEDLERLQRNVLDLAGKADAATQTYDRTAWIRYAAIFVPIPFLVVLFRLQLLAWHYYVVGALFLVFAVAIYVMDLVAVAKRDKAIEAVQRAQEEYEAARISQRNAVHTP